MALLLAGCAYVEYRRVYNIEPRFSAEQRVAVGAAVESYSIDKGYVLKQKYRAHAPDSMQVSEFEIPRIGERKVLQAHLFVSVRDSGVIELRHTEWFWHNNPFGASSHMPGDLLAAARADLITKIEQQLGVAVDIRLSGRGYY